MLLPKLVKIHFTYFQSHVSDMSFFVVEKKGRARIAPRRGKEASF